MVTFKEVLEIFDLLYNKKKLGRFLDSLTEKQKDILYFHPLDNIFDLLP